MFQVPSRRSSNSKAGVVGRLFVSAAGVTGAGFGDGKFELCDGAGVAEVTVVAGAVGAGDAEPVGVFDGGVAVEEFFVVLSAN